MIRVLGHGSCSGAVVECDEWIPLNVSWFPEASSGLPLYIRITGSYGGDFELKADPISGALVQAIVIGFGPEFRIPSIPVSNPQVKAGRPILDLSQLEPEKDSRSSKSRVKVVEMTTDVFFWNSNGSSGITFGDGVAAETLVCGDAAVGITSDGYLADIVASVSPNAGQLQESVSPVNGVAAAVRPAR